MPQSRKDRTGTVGFCCYTLSVSVAHVTSWSIIICPHNHHHLGDFPVKSTVAMEHPTLSSMIFPRNLQSQGISQPPSIEGRCRRCPLFRHPDAPGSQVGEMDAELRVTGSGRATCSFLHQIWLLLTEHGGYPVNDMCLICLVGK